MVTTPNMDILKVDTVIPDPKRFLKELESYVKYIFETNNQELFSNDVVKEMRNHIIKFLIILAESHSGIAVQETKFIEDLFEISNASEVFKTDRIVVLRNRESFFGVVPTYLRQIKRLRNGSDYVTLIIDCITKLGINFAAIDSQYSNIEIKILTDYYKLLTKEIIGSFYLSNEYISKIHSAATNFEKKSNLPPRNINQILNDFDELIGLENVKSELHTLINLARVNKIRKEKNLPIVQTSMHLVFSGNPGTGKTTVARLLSEIYGALGLLSQGTLVEVTRSDLIGEYVGQTAQKTQQVIKKAMGGILFIDEAYSLTQGGKEDFGNEAIAELIKEMEDNRRDLVVIVAGYTDEMDKFIETNPGMKSRFNKYINFPDYTSEELLEILKSMLKKHKYTISEELAFRIFNFFQRIDKIEFSNARGVRNLFEKMLEQQANRIVNIPKLKTSDLQILTLDDFVNAINTMNTKQF